MALSTQVKNINWKLNGNRNNIYCNTMYIPRIVHLVGQAWVMVNDTKCQTAAIACVAGGRIHILSYLTSHYLVDLQMAGG